MCSRSISSRRHAHSDIVVRRSARASYLAQLYRPCLDAEILRKNWGLKPITNRSRDNLPNPLTDRSPYVPVNSPAIGDMMDMFDFDENRRSDDH